MEQLGSEASVVRFAEKFLKRKSKVTQHQLYLNGLCRSFYGQLKGLIQHACSTKRVQFYTPLTKEVLQHWHFAQLRCSVFEGRTDILREALSYVCKTDTNTPLVIYGNSGCGKTSSVAKLGSILNSCLATCRNDSSSLTDVVNKYIQKLCNAADEPSGESTDQEKESNAVPNPRAGSDKGSQDDLIPVLCLRFLGTTPHTSNIQELMVNLCQQISHCTSMKWDEPEKYSDLVVAFHALLHKASAKHKLIILLDSIDQLALSYNALKLKWLPTELPPNVKLIVSTLDEGYDLLDTIKDRYAGKDLVCLEVKPFEQETGLVVINQWLRRLDRGMTNQQEEVVKRALSVCGLPLFARIMFDQVRRWKSYDTPTFESLETTVRGAINKLYQQMEVKFGKVLVKHCLSYLTASRHGLSETELEHILSLDDELLNKIYKFWRPPIRRIPPLMWTRVRAEIDSYIVERSADDVLVIYWYHRQFIMATKERYLADKEFSLYVHKIMAEFFLGKWGGGRKKTFLYTEAQKKRFNLSETSSAEDRKVPLQPYVVSAGHAGLTAERYNQRKLSELPFHLLKSMQYDSLRKEVFFNFLWMYAKIKSTSAQNMCQEVEVFMMADRQIRRDPEYKILFATLQLIRPYLYKYPESLSYELTGRLAKYLGSEHSSLDNLVRQCDRHGLKYCPLVPMFTCFESAQLGLKQNISIRQSELWHSGGAFTCTPDYKTMYLIDYDESGDTYLGTWDMDTGEQIHHVPIQRNVHKNILNLYFKCCLDKAGKTIVALYRQKYFGGKSTSPGFGDIIDIETGVVRKTIEGYVYGRGFYNPMFFMTQNWVAIQNRSKLPLHHLHKDKMFRRSIPHMLFPDESCIVDTFSKKLPGKRQSRRTKMTTIRQFPTKADQGTFDQSERVDCICVTSDGGRVILGDVMGTLRVYEINRLAPERLFKVHWTLTLPEGERVTVKDGCEEHQTQDSSSESDEDDNEPSNAASKSKQQVKVKPPRWREKIAFWLTLILSPTETHIISCHQGPLHWEAFLWYLGSNRQQRHQAGDRGKYVGKICSKKFLWKQHPVFSYDSKYILSPRENKVVMISSDTALAIRIFEFGSDIHDICPSRTSNQVGVLLAKEVVVFELEDELEGQPHGGREGKTKKGTHGKDAAPSMQRCLLLEREFVNHQIRQAVTLTKAPTGVLVEEDDVFTVNDSESEKINDFAETLVSCDGTKRIRRCNKLQVIDTTLNLIKYSPVKGDRLFRSPVNGLSLPGNTNSGIAIQDAALLAASGTGTQELFPGDQIVGGNGRVRMRVTEAETGSLKMMVVPSWVTVNELNEDGGKTSSFVVYQETPIAASREYIVTLKTGPSEDFVNALGIGNGKLVSSHSLAGKYGCSRISPDGKRLFVLTKDLTLHTFHGEGFVNESPRVETTHSKTNRFAAKDVIPLTRNPNCVLLHCVDEGATSQHSNHYVLVDLITKACGKRISLLGTFEDVSADGSFAIDSQLRLFDLPSGEVKAEVPYGNAGVAMQVQARISSCGSYIVVVDKQDDSLHVVRISESGANVVCSCRAHAPKLAPTDGLTLRRQGQVVAIQNGNRFILLAFPKLKELKQESLDYGNDYDRAFCLLPPDDTVTTITTEEAIKKLPPIKPKVKKKIQDPVVEWMKEQSENAD